MNRAVLIGNLTKDPELKTTQTGISVTNFVLAVSRRYTNQDGKREADFIPIVAWKAVAETCAKYLRKGSQVAVSGSIQTRSYDAQDGSRRYVTEIIADEVQFLNRIADDEKGDGQTPTPDTRPKQAESRPTTPPPYDIDEDLPF